jgi:hypothetical protein
MDRGRILGRIWDKSLKSFPPCYSQSPLLPFFPPPPPPRPPSKSGLKLVCNVKMETSILQLSRLCPDTSTKLYIHEFGFGTYSSILPIRAGWHSKSQKHAFIYEEMTD